LVEAGINKPGGTREENFHFHDLRHMFGSELLKRGVSPYHIQELFAHSDMRTSAIYISPEQDQLAEAVKRLDDVQESEVLQ
jgi:site-specific recombinase XerD